MYIIYFLYEQWKQENNSYDINDLVNHIHRQLKLDFLRDCHVIHFLMLDEVQDLTQNILSLFVSMVERNIFFCGDTAQTIAKGIGFRFYDLKSVFAK